MPNATYEKTGHPNSFKAAATLESGKQTVNYFKLSALEGVNLARLPYSLRILLENLLRCEDGKTVTADDIRFLASWDPKAEPSLEIAYMPARVLMQDFTGVPAVVDLAAMRDAMKALGGGQAEIEKINPLVPAELVIDHSVQVDEYGSAYSYDLNAALEFTRNRERYAFLKWGQTAFHNFSAVPPGMGICHQVNLEYLARVTFTKTEADGSVTAYPDTLVGTDSHTTMINGLGVLGWGVGGIEAEAAMLGQPVSMLVPQVVGFRLEGQVEGRNDGDGSGADGDGGAAQAGRGGQVCGVLRAGDQRAAAGGSRDDCEHGSGVWSDVRNLPGGRGDGEVSAADGKDRGADCAGGGVLQGAGAVPYRGRSGSRVQLDAAAGSEHGGAERGGAEAAAGSGAAVEDAGEFCVEAAGAAGTECEYGVWCGRWCAGRARAGHASQDGRPGEFGGRDGGGDR